MSAAQPIKRIVRGHKNEWLLIHVVDFDRKRTLPLTGQLLAHSKERSEIHQKELQVHEKHNWLTFTLFAGDPLPKGYAAAF